MFRLSGLVLVLVLAAGLLISGDAWAAVEFTVIDLGTLSGSGDSYAYGINASGQVVGAATISTGFTHAFLYSNGTMADLGKLPNGGNSFGYGLNDSGQVVGTAVASSDDMHAVLYSNGTITDLGNRFTGSSDAYGINDSGQVVGVGGADEAFLYSNGTMTNLGPLLGGGESAAYGINNSGQVVGWTDASGTNHAFLYSNGTTTDLGTLPGGGGSAGEAINASGQVVGESGISGSPYHAFLYSNGTMTDLGTLVPYNYLSIAQGINVSGQVVGFSESSNAYWRAFLYSNGTMNDLNSLISPTSGWDLEDATGINDSGQICGYGVNPAGQADAFLLTPVPEPSTIALLLASATCLLAFAWRRRTRQFASAAAALLVLTAGNVQAQGVFNMPSGETSLSFVPVGNPGNAPDPATGGLYGSVGYAYQMGEYDVTVGQYVQFLNAVAKTDTYGLYNSYMGNPYPSYPTIGITHTGSSGSYSYTVTGSDPQAANCPIFDVTWGDSARFCNWLQNGQPTTLGEVANSTETGAYTLNGAVSNTALMAISRNTGATYFIPSENEWYKAAYFNPSNSTYWAYPTQSNSLPSNVLSATGTNNANFESSTAPYYTDSTNYLTPVGDFSASPGPYGTFDMGGDVYQWNETTVSSSSRGLRGGTWCYYSGNLASSARDDIYPANESNLTGLRVASVPEPSTIALMFAGTVGLLAYAWRRRSFRKVVACLAVLSPALSASLARADVFNMGEQRG